jgi:hypothetical protein
LVELINFEINLEEELNEFEGSFEWKELNEDWFQVSLVMNFVGYSFGHYVFWKFSKLLTYWNLILN